MSTTEESLAAAELEVRELRAEQEYFDAMIRRLVNVTLGRNPYRSEQ